MRYLKKAGLFVVGVGLLLAFSATALADSVNQSVTEGYGSDTTLQKGEIVKLKDNDATKVEPLTLDTITKMQGVVVSASDAAVSLSDNSNHQQVFVATFGRYDVLVSNQNGAIKTGDYVTISSLGGIGMKAGTGEPVVLGRAAAGFDGISNVEGTATLTDSTGKHVSVSLGRVPVNIGIAHNPLQETVDNNVPGFLKKASQLIANKPVSSTRVYLSLAVLVISAIIAGSMLYAGIRSGLVAIGRNPLAKKSITRNIVQVILTSLIIFIIGLFAVYLLLKL
jgi:hypothetical protein